MASSSAGARGRRPPITLTPLVEVAERSFAAHLPTPLTPLIGRAGEIAALRDLLIRPDVRLVTLTGPGGVGKTRLALAAVAAVAAHFADGVAFIELASIRDPDLVLAAIGRYVGIREGGSRPLGDLLQAFLAERELLLVLDNFEQVLPAAPLVSDLLGACSALTVLVTSRELLRLAGEQTYPVPPLAVPDPTLLPPLAHLTQVEAVRLFAERARAARPDFAVTAANAGAVATICRRLDGLPSPSSWRRPGSGSFPPRPCWIGWNRPSPYSRAAHATSRTGCRPCAAPSPGATTSLLPRSNTCSATSPFSSAALRSTRPKQSRVVSRGS